MKWDYLRFMRKQRLDVLIHILTEQLEPDYRTKDLRVALGFEETSLSMAELASRKAAEGIDLADIDDMVAETGDGSVSLSSHPHE